MIKFEKNKEKIKSALNIYKNAVNKEQAQIEIFEKMGDADHKEIYLKPRKGSGGGGFKFRGHLVSGSSFKSGKKSSSSEGGSSSGDEEEDEEEDAEAEHLEMMLQAAMVEDGEIDEDGTDEEADEVEAQIEVMLEEQMQMNKSDSVTEDQSHDNEPSSNTNDGDNPPVEDEDLIECEGNHEFEHHHHFMLGEPREPGSINPTDGGAYDYDDDEDKIIQTQMAAVLDEDLDNIRCMENYEFEVAEFSYREVVEDKYFENCDYYKTPMGEYKSFRKLGEFGSQSTSKRKINNLKSEQSELEKNFSVLFTQDTSSQILQDLDILEASYLASGYPEAEMEEDNVRGPEITV